MKILALLGSPRRKGNTAALLEKFVEGAASKKVVAETVFLHDLHIAPCTACNACKRKQGAPCVIDDDMSSLYSKVYEADVLVLATPIYWWNISAQLKLFMDRLYAADYEKLKGKKIFLVMTYGGELPNLGPELVEKMYVDICDWLEMDFGGVVGACSELLPVAQNQDALNEAFSLGASVKG
ncbi:MULTISPECIES: flavodoxin family protein [Aminobacterium]|jgi:multimeric flavodoxin WrbA|uniref:flavodoxin family protein n=1 Tax=Aminobacterium TaxID=81466 RepID=UPI000467D650|nr:MULTISPECIES: flavodoxin family protein [Aminobacterium]